MSTQSPIDLSRAPIHLDDASGSSTLENFGFDGPAFEAYIEAHCSEESPGRLVMVETTPVTWSTWECHPLGDESRVLLQDSSRYA